LIIQWVFFILSVIISLFFFLYGFNHYYMLSKAKHYKQPPCLDCPSLRPAVSIQLPIYNEKYVTHRLMDACTRMVEVYGIDKAQIVLLDDSDDDTIEEIDKVVEDYRQRNFNIEIFRRGTRQGFKAGALQIALERTPEDFISIFDADFTPPPDFLVRTLPYFAQDENLGIVQSRWGHLNRDFNILTRGTAILMDIHFIIEQTGRYAAGFFQNFNGSGGVLRKKAILEAGGWQADTLAEDLDLSYRMQLKGYKVLYLRDLQSPGEIPPTIPSYKQQQSRWACGSLRAARKILPILAQQPEINFRKRLQAFIHLTGYFIHPLMAISFILACLSTFLNVGAVSHLPYPYVSSFHRNIEVAFSTTSVFQDITWLILVPFIFLCTIAPWVSAIKTLQLQKLPLFSNLPSLLALFLVGFGASLNNTIGAGQALFSDRAYEWTRTPKYADLQNAEGWRTKKYQIASNYVWLLELAFAGFGTLACALAIRNTNFTVLLILVPFTVAYAFVSLLSFRQS
jgi:cellulose synthase/poly-beta-1,6-N-acetylglucosamine synthase-like glycosyltransferase